jgi:hypothetical protein
VAQAFDFALPVMGEELSGVGVHLVEQRSLSMRVRCPRFAFAAIADGGPRAAESVRYVRGGALHPFTALIHGLLETLVPITVGHRD